MEINTKDFQKQCFDECETAGWDPEKKNSFAEEIAHLHEEVSEAFRAFRNYHDCGVYYVCIKCGRTVVMVTDRVQHPLSRHHYSPVGNDCWGDFKPEGIPIEFADVLIGLFYNAQLHGFDLFEAVSIKHTWNLQRSYEKEGRRLH